MTFEGQYLTYIEYKALGGTLEETPFNLLEFESRKQIDEKTQFRLKDVDASEIPNEVKLCDFKLINSIENYIETLSNANNGVESENIDGYSVKYISATNVKEVIQSKNAELVDIITTELYGVIVNDEHIIYAGVK